MTHSDTRLAFDRGQQNWFICVLGFVHYRAHENTIELCKRPWEEENRRPHGNRMLTKAILERALAAEMTDHLGYEKDDPAGHHRNTPRLRENPCPSPSPPVTTSASRPSLAPVYVAAYTWYIAGATGGELRHCENDSAVQLDGAEAAY